MTLSAHFTSNGFFSACTRQDRRVSQAIAKSLAQRLRPDRDLRLAGLRTVGINGEGVMADNNFSDIPNWLTAAGGGGIITLIGSWITGFITRKPTLQAVVDAKIKTLLDGYEAQMKSMRDSYEMQLRSMKEGYERELSTLRNELQVFKAQIVHASATAGMTKPPDDFAHPTLAIPSDEDD